jgi:copper transport protein
VDKQSGALGTERLQRGEALSYTAHSRMNSHFTATQRTRRLLGATCLMALVFLGFAAQPASAHNGLVSSVPADGAKLTEAPKTWSLIFTGDVPLGSATAEIVAANGVRTPLGAPTHGVTNKEILFALPPDITGAVTGRWRLVGTDGHVVSARVKFTVAPTAADTATTLPGTDAAVDGGPVAADADSAAVVIDDTVTPEPVRLGVRSMGYVGLLIVGGMLFTELFIAQGILGATRARETLLVAGAMLVAAPLLQTLIFLDDSREFGVASSVFHIFEAFDTTAGSMHFLRFLTGAVLLAGIIRAGRTASKALVAPAMLASAAVYITSLAYTGHSRSMAWPVLGVPSAVIHTVATAVWLGGLIVFIFFVIPSLQPKQSFDAFRRFGDAAQYAVIAMVITGIIQTLRLHGNLGTLFTQSHGRWLLLKLVLVASMLKIGDINRRRLLRKLPADEAAFAGRVALLRRASITEIINGGLVMLVTAVLVSASFN